MSTKNSNSDQGAAILLTQLPGAPIHSKNV
jgi:hypothetical protein